MKSRILNILVIVFSSLSIVAQTNFEKIQNTINWNKPISSIEFEKNEVSRLNFEGAVYDSPNDLPHFFGHIKLKQDLSKVDLKVVSLEESILSKSEINLMDSIPSDLKLEYFIAYHQKKPFLSFQFVPIYINAVGNVVKINKFSIELVSSEEKLNKNARNSSFKNSSVLGSGVWYKFGVTEDGIYKLGKSFFSKLGLSPNEFQLEDVRIFGNGGNMLPFKNDDFRIDDLQELPIKIINEGSDAFEKDDHILFYASGTQTLTYNTASEIYTHSNNLFSDTSYYFLSVDYSVGTPKRIQSRSESGASTYSSSSFDDILIFDDDRISLLKTGREWFGEQFGIKKLYSFKASFPNIVRDEPVWVDFRGAVRSANSKSTFKIEVSDQTTSIDSAFPTVIIGYDQQYARLGRMNFEFLPTKSSFDVLVSFEKGVNDATAWMDYLRIQARRILKYEGSPLIIQDSKTIGKGIVEYKLDYSNQEISIWDITSEGDVFEVLQVKNNGNLVWKSQSAELKRFIAFSNEDFKFPQSILGKIEPQNLHASGFFDMIIVTTKEFYNQSEELAQLHREKDSLSVLTTTVDEIYNEFSSGKQDITAIKDFMRMFYERAGNDSTKMPKYLLLVGDASFDYKGVNKGNVNFVPTYQSKNSLVPGRSYASDDYFGLLDFDESDNVNDLVDIGIGRFPIKNKSELTDILAKIKRYYSTSTFGDWRNYFAYLGDDEDGNLHMEQAEGHARYIDTNYQAYNTDKIYFDAYKQIQTPGGARYPDAKKSMNQRIEKGALVIVYVGHGGSLGWAHERVLELSDINNWNNSNNMPLFVTATCEFSRFDNPFRTSAGEFILLNPDGGGIGLLTTTRLVYSTDNNVLTRAFNTNVLESQKNGNKPRTGDLTRMTKVYGPKSINTRCFVYLGDPAVKLAYPKHKILIESAPDTIKALEKVTFSGKVVNENGVFLNDFNGIIYPTVFDKEEIVSTLNNDNEGVFKFTLQNKVIFKGKASVKDGRFSYSFVVPKDISRTYGSGKASLYANSELIDANGYESSFLVGGVSDEIANDTKGPQIDLFLNSESFVSGGMTNKEPIMIASLFDEHGINTVGNGIGHDIVVILDGESSNAILLNDYYESDLNSYQSGKIKYNLDNLSAGKHTLKLKAWDVYNNSGETEIEFFVSESEDIALDHVLNYPNPFTTNTDFFFEHNQPEQNLQIKIQVFTVSGKVVKTIHGFYQSEGFRIGPINWDGKDDFGDDIGKGVYVYKLNVISPNGQSAEVYEKLVILN